MNELKPELPFIGDSGYFLGGNIMKRDLTEQELLWLNELKQEANKLERREIVTLSKRAFPAINNVALKLEQAILEECNQDRLMTDIIYSVCSVIDKISKQDAFVIFNSRFARDYIWSRFDEFDITECKIPFVAVLAEQGIKCYYKHLMKNSLRDILSNVLIEYSKICEGVILKKSLTANEIKKVIKEHLEEPDLIHVTPRCLFDAFDIALYLQSSKSAKR